MFKIGKKYCIREGEEQKFLLSASNRNSSINAVILTSEFIVEDMKGHNVTMISTASGNDGKILHSCQSNVLIYDEEFDFFKEVPENFDFGCTITMKSGDPLSFTVKDERSRLRVISLLQAIKFK
ncbi:Phage protein [Escherichia phage vB_Eco_CP]